MRCQVGMSVEVFQLRHMGALLLRPKPALRDPRVASFNPDPWQRKLLDTVDEGEHAATCACTVRAAQSAT